MKLAVFTPLPPAPTGIADYCERLLEALARDGTWTVRAYSPQSEGDFGFPVQPPDTFIAGEASQAGQVTMFHVGNSPHHDFLYPALFERPGVLVLHDLVLHHARLNAYVESPVVAAYRADLANLEKRAEALAMFDRYRAEVREAYPERGASVAEVALRTGGGRLLYDYPLYEHLVRRSRLTLVHSASASDAIRQAVPDGKVETIRMGMPAIQPVPRELARKTLGLDGEPGPILASFGLVTPEKRISTALRALRRLRASGLPARYLLVGGRVDHYDAMEEARSLGVADAVVATGRVPEDEFLLYAFAADVCLNLRYPSAGETSATLLQLMGCGRAVLVTDQIQATDFPENVLARSPLDGEEHGLYCDLKALLEDDPRREAIEAAAREFVEREHGLEQMVGDYLRALAPFSR